MANGLTRLANRFAGETAPVDKVREHVGKPLDAAAALGLGLVTVTPDELDWEDEIRLAIEERASLSPDALTGLEASLRFAGAGDDGDAHVRAPFGLAELDLQPAERDRDAGRAQTVRHRHETEIRLGARLVSFARLHPTSSFPRKRESRATSRRSSWVPAFAGTTKES